MNRVPIPAPEQASKPSRYGAAGESLPEHLQEALRRLVARAEEDNRMARMEQVKRVQRQREFFRGNQNIFFDEIASRWARVTEAGLGLPTEIPENAVKYAYVENLYRVESLLHIAILRQNPPACQFRPQSFDQPEDVATAREAKVAMEFVVANNGLERRMADAIWLLDHDGACFSYTHWEESKELYGSDWFQPMGTEQKEIPGKAICESCGYEYPEMTPDGLCPHCAEVGTVSPLTPVAPEMVAVDVPQGDPEEEPRGQERALFMGALEVAVPFSARTLRDCGWLTWEAECEKALIKTLYPGVADKSLELPATTDTGDAEEARQARLALMGTSYGRGTTDSHANLITFRRTWMRPWYFNTLDDQATAKELVEAFPIGCYVAFAGPTYCESRPEQIEERWKWVPAYPGDGMMRDGWLTDFVDHQRKINTGENIKFEIFERGLGTRFIDDKAVDYDAYIEQGAQAVNEMPISLRPGEKAGDKIYDSPPAEPSQWLTHDLDSMRGNRSEKLTGNFAAAFGGDTGTNDTASGIAEVKDSAMGRMSYFKEILNELYAGTVLNLIRCFRKHRSADVRYAVEGPSGELDAAIIHIDQLKGNFYAITEAEDSYPVSPAQKRAVVLQVLNGQPTALQQALFAPENYDLVRWAVGEDIKLPGEQARRKQMREIERMKRGEYVQVDAMLDQHDYEIGAMNEWGSSEDGQNAAPEVRMLVAQHMTDHMKAQAVIAKLQQGLAPPMPVDPAAMEGGAPAPM